jgi:hypothetical protein
MFHIRYMAFLLACFCLLSNPACQATSSSSLVDRHDPEAVLRAYFAAWGRNDTEVQKSFMTTDYANLIREPVDSLRVLAVSTKDAASATTRVYSVSVEINLSGGRSISMISGRYDWTYTLKWDAARESWLIANYGAG